MQSWKRSGRVKKLRNLKITFHINHFLIHPNPIWVRLFMPKRRATATTANAYRVLYWPENWLNCKNGKQEECRLLSGWKIQVEGVASTIVVDSLSDPKLLSDVPDSDRGLYQGSIDGINQFAMWDHFGIVGSICDGSPSVGNQEVHDRLLVPPEDAMITISIDENGLPIPSEDSFVSQIVLYHRARMEDRSFVAYDHCLCQEFSRSILLRLMYSAYVRDAIKISSSGNPRQPLLLVDTSSTNVAKSRKAENDSKHHPMLRLVTQNSLFFHHILCSSRESASNLWTEGDASLQDSCPTIRKRWITHSNEVSRCIIEAFSLAILVLLMGVFVSTETVEQQQQWLMNLYQSHYRWLALGRTWLENFPVGLKLNQSCMEAIGREVQRAWEIHEWVVVECLLMQAVPPVTASRWVLATVVGVVGACTGGASGVLALLFDVYRLLFLHLTVLHWVSHQVYVMELSLLASSWRLFRGKKLNPLRQRTDTMEYDSMQLLLGTVLFAVLLFLFTTIFAYQVFSVILYAALMIGPVAIGVFYQLVLYGPWGHLYLRLRRPGLFCKDVVIGEIANSTDNWSAPPVTQLVPRLQTFHSILSQALSPHLSSLLTWPFATIAVGFVGGSTTNGSSIISCITKTKAARTRP